MRGRRVRSAIGSSTSTTSRNARLAGGALPRAARPGDVRARRRARGRTRRARSSSLRPGQADGVRRGAGDDARRAGGTPGRRTSPRAGEIWAPLDPLYESGEYAEAADRGRETIEAHPEYPAPLYNLACCESLAGRTDDAIEHLRLAIDGNEPFRSLAAEDSDFDPIRDEPAFKDLVSGSAAEPATGNGPRAGFRRQTDLARARSWHIVRVWQPSRCVRYLYVDASPDCRPILGLVPAFDVRQLRRARSASAPVASHGAGGRENSSRPRPIFRVSPVVRCSTASSGPGTESPTSRETTRPCSTRAG